mmetsp:Transcript_7590/g.18548  ORF Transcript_7590/g.18548 Transcript_7590/m.18548 type:complete len:81 (-) Transcript_7590:422-664(-)
MVVHNTRRRTQKLIRNERLATAREIDRDSSAINKTINETLIYKRFTRHTFVRLAHLTLSLCKIFRNVAVQPSVLRRHERR